MKLRSSAVALLLLSTCDGRSSPIGEYSRAQEIADSVTLFNDTDVLNRRTALIRKLWNTSTINTTETGFTPVTIAIPMQPAPANLLRVDRVLEIGEK